MTVVPHLHLYGVNVNHSVSFYGWKCRFMKAALDLAWAKSFYVLRNWNVTALKKPNLTGLFHHRWEQMGIKFCQVALWSVPLGLHFVVLLQTALQIPSILHSWQLWCEVCQVFNSFLEVGHQKAVADRKMPGKISVCEHYTGCCNDFNLNGIAAMFSFTVLFELTPSNSATNEQGLLCCFYSFRHVFVLHSSVLSSPQTLIIFLTHFLMSGDQIKWDALDGVTVKAATDRLYTFERELGWWVCLCECVGACACPQSDESVSLSTFPDRDAEWVLLMAGCSALMGLMFPEVLNVCEGGPVLVWKQRGWAGVFGQVCPSTITDDVERCL